MGKKILLTGGHAATTALAVIEEIKKRHDDWEIYWVGSGSAIEGRKVNPIENVVFPRIGIKSYEITTGRLQRRFSLWTFPSLFKVPVGFIQAFKLIKKLKPDIVLSFGGYVALPVVVSSWLLRVPVIVQEQVASAGKSNEISSHFAKKVLLARAESLKYYPQKKVWVTGNPVMTSITSVKPKSKPARPMTIYITGGSRGSQALNNLIPPVLVDLLGDYKVIHQTGELEYQKFLNLKKTLPQPLRYRYTVYALVDPLYVHAVYKKADIVVARAGANTVSEIMITKRPSILIPIPWSYKNEQTENAIQARKFGIATILEQDSTKPEDLLGTIKDISGSWNEIANKVIQKQSPDLLASTKVVDELEGDL